MGHANPLRLATSKKVFIQTYVSSSHKKRTMTPPALLLIDIQEGLDEPGYWGTERNNPDAEQHMAALLAFWRTKGWPVVHVKHNSALPASPLVKGKPGNAIKAMVAPLLGEPLIEKSVNSAFIGTDLQVRLDDLGTEKLVIVGLTTDHCVSTTARMAGNLGFDTYVVADATATFDRTGPDGTHIPAELMHRIHLASLQGEFATVLTASELIDRLSS